MDKRAYFKDFSKFIPIYVQWIDSESYDDGWEDLSYIDDEAGKGVDLVCETVGWLMGENKKCITIGHSYAKSTDQGYAIMHIPKCAILKRINLKGIL